MREAAAFCDGPELNKVIAGKSGETPLLLGPPVMVMPATPRGVFSPTDIHADVKHFVQCDLPPRFVRALLA